MEGDGRRLGRKEAQYVGPFPLVGFPSLPNPSEGNGEAPARLRALAHAAPERACNLLSPPLWMKEVPLVAGLASRALRSDG